MITHAWFRFDEVLPLVISGWILALWHVRQRPLGSRVFHLSAMS